MRTIQFILVLSGLFLSFIQANFVEFIVRSGADSILPTLSPTDCLLYYEHPNFTSQKCYLIAENHELVEGRNIVRSRRDSTFDITVVWNRLKIECTNYHSEAFLAINTNTTRNHSNSIFRVLLVSFFVISTTVHVMISLY